MKCILTVALGIAWAFTAPLLAADGARDSSAVSATFPRLDGCIASKDLACIEEMFAADATLIGPLGGGDLVKGKAAIVGAFKKMIDDLDLGTATRKHSVQSVRFIDDQHALVDWSASSGETAREKWYVTALVTSQDGKWVFTDLRSYAVAQAVKAEPTPVPTPVKEEPSAPEGTAEPSKAES